MKLANLSFCLVLVGVLSGCFSGTKLQNATPEPQQKSLADLKLQPLKLDAGGRLTAQSVKELRDFAVSKNTEPIFIVANNFNDKTIANISESVAKSEIKQAITLVDTANNTLIHILKPIREGKKWEQKPERKLYVCEVRPDVCVSKGLEKYKNCSNCLLERIECRQKTNCLADLLEKAEVVKAGRTNGKVFTLAEANEKMFAIYDANMTNSNLKAQKRKAKQ